MGARYYDPVVGRFTQPEPAWSNPMFNTLGGRNLLVGRGYGAGAGVGQGTAPMPTGYYRPGSEYNWYSYTGNDPVNGSDVTGYWNWGKIGTGLLVFGAGAGLAVLGGAVTAIGVAELAAIPEVGPIAIYTGIHTIAYGTLIMFPAVVSAGAGFVLVVEGMRE